MSNNQENQDNFWSVFGAAQPEQEKPTVFYRLYYDELGCPLFYTMEDLPGNYIELDRETYMRSPKYVRVRDGKLVEIIVQNFKKLVPSEDGTACYYKDVSIVAKDTNMIKHWKLKDYESS